VRTAGPPVPHALDLWDAMLTMTPPVPSRPEDVVSPGLAAAADLVHEAVFATGEGGRRRVPSAGAIYPYLVLALCRTAPDRSRVPAAGRWELFEFGDHGRATLLQVSGSLVTRLAVWAMGGDHPDGPDGAADFAVLVLTRPWLSMRKYGPRGYLYTHLDAGHAATNLLGVALERGRAELRLAPHDELMSRSTEWCFPHHELHSAVTVRGAAGECRSRRLDVRPTPTLSGDPRFDLEARLWREIVEPMTTRTGHGPVSTAPLVDLGDGQPADVLQPGEWSWWARRRRSARSFGTRPLDAADLAEVLAGAATPLPTNAWEARGRAGKAGRERPPVAGHLVLTPAAGPDVAVGLRSSAVRRMPGCTDPADVVAACMGQPHVRNAQAFLVLHASRADVLPSSPKHRLQPTIFCAGAAAQLVYLAATRAGIGAFTVGGFRQTRWQRYAGLDASRDVVCLIALGSRERDAVPGERPDRLAPPIAHGGR
jgi:nitroreductase